MRIGDLYLEVLDVLNRALENHGISHFRAEEFIQLHRGIPPIEILPNILQTVVILEEVRDHFKKPVLITSGYRSPAYNKRIGGAPKSLHVQFNAVDIVVRDIPAQVVYDWLDNHALSHRFGLGNGYNFTHFDTRGTLEGLDYKAPARWTY